MSRKQITALTTIFIVGIFFLFPRMGEADDVVIITNKSVPIDTLKKEDIKNIFIGKMTRWNDNEKINFVTLPKSKIHEGFLKKFVKKTPEQYSRHWKKQIFTGKGNKPRSFKTEESLIDYVASTKGAIGYVSPELINDKIKVLTVD
jgi:ABC-type phosphate transport system substrate-binding protein